MDINQINNKTNTAILIDYLESSIGDEMILNSFVRDLQIVFSDESNVVISVTSYQAKEIFQHELKSVLNQGIEQVFQKYMKHSIILQGEGVHLESKDKQKKLSRNVSPKFKLDTYVTSGFNRETVAIAKKVIAKPGFFSPLYISSNSGLGKTHLLHGIANAYDEKGLSCAYIEPSSFTRKVQNYSKEGGDALSMYIDDILGFDVLIFDDIQNLGDRTVTLKVLFSIINKAMEADKQIIIASDKVAQELSGFEARFITRFGSGLSTIIQPPETEDLVKILEFKLDKAGMSPAKWEKEALKFVARNNSNSIRALEGAIKRVVFFTENESNISYTTAVISNIFKELALDPSELTPARILQVVAGYYKINKSDIIGKSRKQQFVVARHMAMWLIRKINNLSYVEIGKIMGGRDHSTIMSGINKIEHQMKINSAVKVAAERLENKIKKAS